MHADEKAIIEYLKAWPTTYVSGREIARKVGGKRRYAEDRGWAIPVLAQMVQKGMIESDFMGHFRLKGDPRKKKQNHKHVSPQLLRILKSSGKSFEGIAIDEEEDEEAAPKPAPNPFPLEEEKE